MWNAFRAQLLNCVKHIMVQVYTALDLKPKYIAAPFCSMLHDLAMEHGRDLHTHGEYFPGALDASCIDGVGGFGTAIDSLAAIKHLIYDTKKLTWDQRWMRWKRTGKAKRSSANSVSTHRSTATASSGWMRSASISN